LSESTLNKAISVLPLDPNPVLFVVCDSPIAEAAPSPPDNVGNETICASP